MRWYDDAQFVVTFALLVTLISFSFWLYTRHVPAPPTLVPCTYRCLGMGEHIGPSGLADYQERSPDPDRE